MLCPSPPSAAFMHHTMPEAQRKQGLLKAALLFLVLALSLRGSAGVSDPVEVLALQAIKRDIGDGFGKLANWVGDDPCGANWTGVICTTINETQYVTELRLLNMNFTGTLAPDIGNLTQLVIMDFMWNNIVGSIPPEVGFLSNLYLLLLNGNKLSGVLPSELGNLSKLNRIQIDQNNISGPVPSSFQFLNQAKHFHMNNNSLNESIPAELGQLENLVHLLLDNNALSGELPPELWNISTLLILQLDNNQFSGSIPSSYANMSTLTKLSLRNCNLTGPIPDLSKMATLGYLDLSHNQLTGQLPSNVSQVITTIDLSYNQLNGEIPLDLYGLNSLEFLLLRNNSLDGNVTANLLTHNSFTTADSILVLDFQDNNITGFTSGALLSLPNVTLRLYGNPVCSDSSAPANLCAEYNGTDTNVSVPTTAVPLPQGCSTDTCDTRNNQELVYGLFVSGSCHCAYPLLVGYRLKSPGFAIFPPYEDGFQVYLSSGLNLSEYQVNVSDYSWEFGPRLAMNIKLFPSSNTSQFTDSEVSHLYDTFATWNIPDNNTFGPYEVLSFTMGYPYNVSVLVTAGSTSTLSGGTIAGIVIGAVAFTAAAVAAVMLLIAKCQPRYAAAPSRAARHHERMKIQGVKDFTFEEMANATKNFDTSTQIGQGGYGKVYKGILADGLVVAIKRAQEGSIQGAHEFYTEIELLSRVHHRNLVSLIGFCDDQGEEMLVYEFMANGTLRDHLNPSSSRLPLDFPSRLQIALGSAKGILYLHTEANPPIFHRDIKATNILLDGKRRAKVADFGLSKLAPEAELEGDTGGHVSTVVKGTPGYLDPEYFQTRKLTDKSDVYSFGVVLLELVTGMHPISQGKNLVREVNSAYESGMMLSIVDPRMGSYPTECLQPFVRLAMSCCKNDTDSRPSMAEVVRELEAIWRQTPLTDSAASFETSMSTEPVQLTNSPYVSSDIEGSGLMSGAIPQVAPR